MFREVSFARFKNLEFWFNPNGNYEYVFLIARTGEHTILTTPRDDKYYGGISKFTDIRLEEGHSLVFLQALGSPFENFVYSVKKNSFLQNPQVGRGYCFGSGYLIRGNYCQIQSGSPYDSQTRFRLNLITHEFERYY